MSTGDGDFYESGDLPRNVKIPVERFEIEEDDSISGGGSTGGGGGGGGAIGTILKRSAHPLVALFHIGFKIAAVASYLLLGILLHNFVIQFVVTIILLAVDFWTTKNLSGRLLVGLRWWTDVQEDGSTSWRFECIEVRQITLSTCRTGRRNEIEIFSSGTIFPSPPLFYKFPSVLLLFVVLTATDQLPLLTLVFSSLSPLLSLSPSLLPWTTDRQTSCRMTRC